MTPAEFIARWRDNPSSERAGAQAFFLDLCDLLGVEKPNDPDRYCFERGATRTGAGRGWADVWKRDCFAWENKAPGKDLAAALKQLMTYALALDNPPLLVVSDRWIIQIHTHFTGMPSEVHTVRLGEIGLPGRPVRDGGFGPTDHGGNRGAAGGGEAGLVAHRAVPFAPLSPREREVFGQLLRL